MVYQLLIRSVSLFKDSLSDSRLSYLLALILNAAIVFLASLIQYLFNCFSCTLYLSLDILQLLSLELQLGFEWKIYLLLDILQCEVLEVWILINEQKLVFKPDEVFKLQLILAQALNDLFQFHIIFERYVGEVVVFFDNLLLKALPVLHSLLAFLYFSHNLTVWGCVLLRTFLHYLC